jgi:hypothetical protein
VPENNDRVNSEIHSKAVIERDWICTVDRDRANLEAVIGGV